MPFQTFQLHQASNAHHRRRPDGQARTTAPARKKESPWSAELAFRAVVRHGTAIIQQLEVDYVLTTDLPSSDPPATTPTSSDLESSTGPSTTAVDQVKKDQVIDLEKYAKDNKTVRGHLLNYMSNPMFDLFIAQKSAKDI
ncbi:ty1-copia retrotransposon protein [Cucumis melo var. makuwa]|uniref:Ty1-copia retrotransposon protein n=1 Tax=Cucumis melo var. makuwa TaxID=1194695 RepID=A0A5A7TLN7_CUCMM|nr:ty1-copia retrotransposon protein [Cucumis melo var. makuwa]